MGCDAVLIFAGQYKEECSNTLKSGGFVALLNALVKSSKGLVGPRERSSAVHEVSYLCAS